MRSTSHLPLFGALGALVLVVAACSSSGASVSAPAAVQPSAAPSAGGSAAAGGETYTVVAASGSVGAYLTGEGGKTLYAFTPDSPDTTTCVDACAQTWPPFVVESADTLKAGDGVAGTLTTFARPDGTMQVAYNRIPMYYFAKDAKAGDTSGQGINGKWFVAAPTGPLPSASSISAY